MNRAFFTLPDLDSLPVAEVFPRSKFHDPLWTCRLLITAFSASSLVTRHHISFFVVHILLVTACESLIFLTSVDGPLVGFLQNSFWKIKEFYGIQDCSPVFAMLLRRGYSPPVGTPYRLIGDALTSAVLPR